jgi:hypothetical protein
MPALVAAHTIRRIAHPTDFSIASGNALTWAIGTAQQYQPELLLLHVVPPPTPFLSLNHL